MGFINALSLYLFFPDSLSSVALQCIQNLNFDPPTACQTADLKPGAIRCMLMCVCVCVCVCVFVSVCGSLL